MRIRGFTWCLLGLWGLPFLQADTIVLRSGEHVEGQIVSETQNEVSIRRKFKTGNIYYVDKISKADIARVERSATPAANSEPPAGAAASRPATGEQQVAAAKIPDKPAFLEGAIQKFEKPDYRGAGMDLSRLIISSPPGELQRFSATVEEKLQMPLAEMAATAHFKAALEQARGRAVTLQYVTDYEKPVLIPMLEDAYEKAITMQVVTADDEDDDDQEGHEAEGGKDDDDRPRAGARPVGGRAADVRGRGAERRGAPRDARGRGARVATEREDNDHEEKEGKEHEAEHDNKEPASRPAMSIKSWLNHPADFDGKRLAAGAMEIQIYHARSLLAERIRLDPKVRTDADLKAQLTGDKVKLEALLKAVKARAGGALTPREREAQEAHIRNQWDAVRREDFRRRNEALTGLQRIIEEQQRQPPPGGAAPRPKE